MRYVLPISAAPLLLSAVTLAGGQEVPIEFRESSGLKGAMPYGSSFMQLQTEVPAGEWKLPRSLMRPPRMPLRSSNPDPSRLVPT